MVGIVNVRYLLHPRFRLESYRGVFVIQIKASVGADSVLIRRLLYAWCSSFVGRDFTCTAYAICSKGGGTFPEKLIVWKFDRTLTRRSLFPSWRLQTVCKECQSRIAAGGNLCSWDTSVPSAFGCWANEVIPDSGGEQT